MNSGNIATIVLLVLKINLSIETSEETSLSYFVLCVFFTFFNLTAEVMPRLFLVSKNKERVKKKRKKVSLIHAFFKWQIFSQKILYVTSVMHERSLYKSFTIIRYNHKEQWLAKLKTKKDYIQKRKVSNPKMLLTTAQSCSSQQSRSAATFMATEEAQYQ